VQGLAHLDEARRVNERLDEHLVAAGREGDRPFVLGQLALVEFGAGNWELAAEFARRSRELAVTYDQPVFAAQAAGVLGLMHASSGDEVLATTELDRVADFVERAQWAVGHIYVAHGRAELALLRDDHAAVWAILEPVVSVVAEFGPLEWVHAIVLPNAVEALAALGRLDEARHLADALVAHGAEGQRRWATAVGLRCQAVVADAVGDLDAAAAAAAASLAAHADLPMRMDLARTLLVAGRIERRRNARRSAQDQFTRAAELARAAGATAWAERAELELSRMPRRTRDGTGLTAAELGVAQLVAQGLTNAEVAARLHMSAKTVEAHLGRVYRKLGVRRAGLGVALAARAAS
jgi:DNA-binding CsgD family transcriptional regulator